MALRLKEKKGKNIFLKRNIVKCKYIESQFCEYIFFEVFSQLVDIVSKINLMICVHSSLAPGVFSRNTTK